MNIGIIGSGGVAKVFGAGLVAKGNKVKLGSRDPEKLTEWTSENAQGGTAGTLAEAAAFGEIIILATAGTAAIDALKLAGLENLKGKTIIDVTNPLDFSAGRPPKFYVSLGDSLGEQIQNAVPEAHVVKAFNTISAYIMVNPKLEEGLATLTICGNDEGAKAQTTALAESFGWDVVDLGGIEHAYWNEALAMLWINFGFKNNHWTHAFRLLRK